MTRLFKWVFALLVLLRMTSAAADSALQRVIVIGASASSGFVLSEPFGGTNTDQCRLSHYLDAAVTVPHDPVKNLASPLLFMSPEAIASQEVEAATNRNPSLVVAVDFLFWFCYGQGQTDADRAERLEYGLGLLEKIPCPLVIGDIPDAAQATNSGIISVSQVPSEAARTAANLRIRQWAAARPDVTLVPLAGFMAAVKTNGPINGQNISVAAGETYSLLQKDRLHPNARGAAMLSLGIFDAFSARHSSISEVVDWNLNEVRNRGLQVALNSKRGLASNQQP